MQYVHDLSATEGAKDYSACQSAASTRSLSQSHNPVSVLAMLALLALLNVIHCHVVKQILRADGGARSQRVTR